LEFWNSFEGSSTLKNMMSKYEKGLSVVTQIGGHEFSNLINCNITLSISYLNVVANVLSKLKGPPFG
jgi:hypothetical protein